jgi:hypothetical protein
MTHREFSTRMELKSLTQQRECAGAESGCLRMFCECLGSSSMHLGVPLIAPRQLGAVEDQHGRLSLPSVEWRTGQSGAPPDNHCRLSGADLLPILAQTTVVAPGQLAHWTQSGAHRTVRCPLPTVGAATRRPQIARPTVGADDRWLTGQSGAPPDSPVNYSRTPPNISRERHVHRRPAWRTGHSSVCQAKLSFGCTEPSLFGSFLLLFSLFLALRQNMLVLKNYVLSLETYLFFDFHFSLHLAHKNLIKCVGHLITKT